MARIDEIVSGLYRISVLTISLLAGMTLLAQSSSAPNPAVKNRTGSQASIGHAMSTKYGDLQWQTMVAELGTPAPSTNRAEACDTAFSGSRHTGRCAAVRVVRRLTPTETAAVRPLDEVGRRPFD